MQRIDIAVKFSWPLTRGSMEATWIPYGESDSDALRGPKPRGIVPEKALSRVGRT